jgi:hypothetical protein
MGLQVREQTSEEVGTICCLSKLPFFLLGVKRISKGHSLTAHLFNCVRVCACMRVWVTGDFISPPLLSPGSHLSRDMVCLES